MTMTICYTNCFYSNTRTNRGKGCNKCKKGRLVFCLMALSHLHLNGPNGTVEYIISNGCGVNWPLVRLYTVPTQSGEWFSEHFKNGSQIHHSMY